MNRDNVTELKPARSSLEYLYNGRKVALSFDERYLYEEWSKGITKGKTAYLLYRLSPNIFEETVISTEYSRSIRTGWALLLASAIIFFSDYNMKIPLLAPVLCVVGLYFVVSNFRKAWPKETVTVYDDLNYEQVVIPVPKRDDGDFKPARDAFVSSLVSAIEEAKRKEYYDE